MLDGQRHFEFSCRCATWASASHSQQPTAHISVSQNAQQGEPYEDRQVGENRSPDMSGPACHGIGLWSLVFCLQPSAPSLTSIILTGHSMYLQQYGRRFLDVRFATQVKPRSVGQNLDLLH